MNIIQERRNARNSAISQIVESIKLSLETSNGEHQFDFESIILAAQANFNCTRRTAIEYSEIALYKCGLNRGDLSDAPKDFKQKKLKWKQ